MENVALGAGVGTFLGAAIAAAFGLDASATIVTLCAGAYFGGAVGAVVDKHRGD